MNPNPCAFGINRRVTRGARGGRNPVRGTCSCLALAEAPSTVDALPSWNDGAQSRRSSTS